MTIRRDGHGIPHITAGADADAWFALGLCHAQDRGFQLETLLRAGRGTVAELVGPDGLAIDRFSRRAGIHRAAQAQLEVLAGDLRGYLDAYARGVNAGFEHGTRRRPHELALLRRRPTPWTAADALASTKLLALGLSANWDMELSRLRVLALDGPEALAAIDPAYPAGLAATAPPGRPAGTAIDHLAGDIEALAALVGAGGGSNNWAVAGSRTATGRPLVANDPHLPPTLPSVWYLAHLTTPEWELAGATVAGSPGMGVGHNGHVAWGMTNGGADIVDLFVEEVSQDGGSVRDADGWVECEVREEVIAVRGGDDVVERVLVTPRGPIVSPALEGEHPAVSLRAVWLEPLPIEGTLRADRARSAADLRERARQWPFANFNLVFGDTSGTIGWQLMGLLPRRTGGHGLLPRPGAEAGVGWDGWVDFEDLPFSVDPEAGFVATANNKPVADSPDGPFLGADWMDGYRVQRIAEALAERDDWDVESTLALQQDQLSLVWRDVRDVVLSAPREDPGARRAVDLLAPWDGIAGAGSAAAAVFELWLAEMTVRAARAKAPNSLEWALGRGVSPVNPYSYLALRQAGHVARAGPRAPGGMVRGRLGRRVRGGAGGGRRAARGPARPRHGRLGVGGAAHSDPAPSLRRAPPVRRRLQPRADPLRRRHQHRLAGLVHAAGSALGPLLPGDAAPGDGRRRVGSRARRPGGRAVGQPALAPLPRPVRALAPGRGRPAGVQLGGRRGRDSRHASA